MRLELKVGFILHFIRFQVLLFASVETVLRDSESHEDDKQAAKKLCCAKVFPKDEQVSQQSIHDGHVADETDKASVFVLEGDAHRG